MKLCYIDEAGCLGALPSATSDIQPVLVFCALVIDQNRLHDITRGFIEAKRRFFPQSSPETSRYLDTILSEVKGAELRKRAASDSRRQRRHAVGFMDACLTAIEEAEIRVFGRVWIKGIGTAFDGRAVYTSSIQRIHEYFQRHLVDSDDIGMVMADSRLKHLNAQVAHSIFTQRFKNAGDGYDRIVELPGFAHSDNHAGLQLCDFLASAIVTPMAIDSFCAGHVRNTHVRSGFGTIRDRYATRIKNLQYRYRDMTGQWRGGLVVRDDIGHRSGGLLFRTRTPAAAAATPTDALSTGPAEGTCPDDAVSLPPRPSPRPRRRRPARRSE